MALLLRKWIDWSYYGNSFNNVLHSAYSGSWVSLHFSEISQVCCNIILKCFLRGAFTPCNLANTIISDLPHPHSDSSVYLLTYSSIISSCTCWYCYHLFICVHVHIYRHICHVCHVVSTYLNIFLYTYFHINVHISYLPIYQFFCKWYTHLEADVWDYLLQNERYIHVHKFKEKTPVTIMVWTPSLLLELLTPVQAGFGFVSFPPTGYF